MPLVQLSVFNMRSIVGITSSGLYLLTLQSFDCTYTYKARRAL